MRYLVLTMAVLTVGAASAKPKLPRNPFWVHGYEGVRHPITLEPRFVAEEPEEPAEPSPESESESEDRAAKEIDRANAEAERQLWSEAKNALRFGSIFSFESKDHLQASIIINDNVYAVGDLISADYNGNRFTWRLESLSSDGKLKLKRIKYCVSRKNP